MAQSRADRTREDLFDLLPDDLFEVAQQLPHGMQLQIRRWFTREADRLAPVMGRVVGGPQHSDQEVTQLLNILAADPLDLQTAGRWLAEHRNELTAQLLAQLVSAAMSRGVMDLMSARASKRQGENREKKAEALRLWELYKVKDKMTRGKAAPLIAAQVGLQASTVRGYLKGL